MVHFNFNIFNDRDNFNFLYKIFIKIKNVIYNIFNFDEKFI